MASFVKVARTGEIAPGEGKAVNLGVRRIALFDIEGMFYAIDDTCTITVGLSPRESLRAQK